MNLNFSMHEADCVALTEDYLHHSSAHQRSRLRAKWMFPIIVSILMAITLVRNGPTMIASTFFPICIFGWLIFYPRRFDARMRNHIHAQMKESSYSKSFGDYQVEINNDGIVSSGPLGRSEHTWASVHRVGISQDYLFVFFSGLSGLPIPVVQIGASRAKEAFELIESYRTKVAG